MFQSPEMLSVMSLSGNFLPATANIRESLAEGISIHGGMFLPVDFLSSGSRAPDRFMRLSQLLHLTHHFF